MRNLLVCEARTRYSSNHWTSGTRRCYLRAIGDPLLRPVDDPKLAIRRLGRTRAYTRNITPGERLRDSKAQQFLACEDLWNDSGFEFWGPEVDDRWKADKYATKQAYMGT